MMGRRGLAYEEQNHLRYERYIYPVPGSSDTIDHLFGVIVYDRVAPRHAKLGDAAGGDRLGDCDFDET